MSSAEKARRLPGRIAFYLLAILSLLVVFALPTSWVYDLGLKAGTEQGQRPGAEVRTLRTDSDVSAFIQAGEPATVSPEGLIPCPLARLRDSEQSNRRIHYSSGRRSSRTFQGFDDYRVLPRDPGALDRLWQLLWGGTYNNGYFLKPLEDGTYLCIYLDDCAFLFGEPEELAGNRPGFSKKKREKKEKTDFFLSREQAKLFPYTEKYLAPELAVQLNELRNSDAVKKTSGAEIIRRSQQQGLSEEQLRDGKRQKIVTEQGKAAGLFLGARISQKGTEYQDIYYNEQAQRMVVEWFVQ